jgi:hypothetical protein
MTTFARWIAILCTGILVVSVIGRHLQLAVFSLMILIWMIAGYLLFRWRTFAALKHLQMVRRIQDRDASTGVVWAGRTYDVELEIRSRSSLYLGWQFRDLVPEILELRSVGNPNPKRERGTEATNANDVDPSLIVKWMRALAKIATPSEHLPTSIDGGYANVSRLVIDRRCKSTSLRYQIKPRGAGVATLRGIRLEMMDSMRWFRIDTVVPCKQVLNVLPSYRDAGELRSFLKNANAIPQHGIHRQRRPGMGFELLELREYTDGDPPKSIAWKASARRETLMIRQYESEIPIRLQFFMEGTVSCRIGGYGLRMIDQMNTVAASITKMATQGGDWVGAYLIHGSGLKRVMPSTGEGGFYRMAKALSEFSAAEFPNRFQLTDAMQESAYALVSEYYPERLQLEVNPSVFTVFDSFRSPLRRQRVQLAAVMAHRYGLSEMDHLELLLNDHAIAACLQRFLFEHGQAWMAPMIPRADVTKYLTQHALDTLVKSIQQAVLRAKDNEVFVLFIDLLSQPRNLSDLMHALKLAKGRHHRVVVVSTSPQFERPQIELFQHSQRNAKQWRDMADGLRIYENANHVKHQLREIAVPFAISAGESTIPMVLSEIELARSGRVSRAGLAARS